ncbi:MAG: ATP-binding protein [Thiotrichales bacterium]
MDAREQLANVLATLSHGLIERRREVRLILLVALAEEHTLLIGPPGTAKSELARRLRWVFRDGLCATRVPFLKEVAGQRLARK